MKSFWVKNLENEKNETLALRKTFAEKTQATLHIAGVSCYKIIADGKLVGFGPYRAAHGKSKILEFSICAKTIVVEINAYNVKSYWLVKEHPFVAISLVVGEEEYTAESFECYRVLDRVKKVQRYSWQRGFLEAYRIGECDRYAFYRGEAANGGLYKRVKLTKTKGNELLPCALSHPTLQEHSFGEPVEMGEVYENDERAVWRDRSMNEVEQIGGYEIEEWEVAPTDEASRFIYAKGYMESRRLYYVYGNGISLTGFFKVHVRVKQAGSLWLLYDELDYQEGIRDNFKGIHVCFFRNGCSNVIKWTFSKEGEYTLDAFEPYTAGFVKVIFDAGIEVLGVSLLRYENPDCEGFIAKIEDQKAQKIVDAAISTFRQNSVDILTDCPSRERAGWLSDTFFSSQVERILTGKNERERAFLENYAQHKPLEDTPKIVPMCYPADDYEGMFIPNWAMWYVLEVNNYKRVYGFDKLVKDSLPIVRSVMEFFMQYENEYGLLEDLPSWVFVEWSDANEKIRTAGMNAPSNACYYATLRAAGILLHDKTYFAKAKRVKKNLLKLTFDGKLFVDNLLRNSFDELVKTQYYTEVCQYYFFYFDVANPVDYAETYALLMNELGVRRKKGTYEHIGTSNAMYGIYMRLELLMREKNARELYRECIEYFYPMADRTGTLWENASPSGSNVHGFASYALKWILYALTGYDGKALKAVETVDINAFFRLPKRRGILEIEVKGGAVTMNKCRK